MHRKHSVVMYYVGALYYTIMRKVTAIMCMKDSKL